MTADGIYYNINTVSDAGQAGASTWQRITGNLFSLTATIFGDDSETEQAITSINTIAADWRYAIPNANGGTHPVLYVGGQGGVFRSLDNGATWQPYPSATTAQVSTAPTASGGGLPVTDVTDLEVSAGNIDPDDRPPGPGRRRPGRPRRLDLRPRRLRDPPGADRPRHPEPRPRPAGPGRQRLGDARRRRDQRPDAGDRRPERVLRLRHDGDGQPLRPHPR